VTTLPTLSAAAIESDRVVLAGRLGFQEVDVFEEHGAKQALAVASLGSFLAS
jgi:hypothetical protein